MASILQPLTLAHASTSAGNVLHDVMLPEPSLDPEGSAAVVLHEVFGPPAGGLDEADAVAPSSSSASFSDTSPVECHPPVPAELARRQVRLWEG